MIFYLYISSDTICTNRANHPQLPCSKRVRIILHMDVNFLILLFTIYYHYYVNPLSRAGSHHPRRKPRTWFLQAHRVQNLILGASGRRGAPGVGPEWVLSHLQVRGAGGGGWRTAPRGCPLVVCVLV